jgi:hypothetical protein
MLAVLFYDLHAFRVQIPDCCTLQISHAASPGPTLTMSSFPRVL